LLSLLSIQKVDIRFSLLPLLLFAFVCWYCRSLWFEQQQPLFCLAQKSRQSLCLKAMPLGFSVGYRKEIETTVMDYVRW
jgi:hypothetical protein